jgi:uncharacterized membrane protein YdjX (TVP38/TMEM64 family)
LVLALPLASTLPPVRAAMLALVTYMRESGAAGVALYAAACLGAALVLAPVALFCGLAGFAYGPLRGVAVASPSVTLGATAVFVVGRLFLRAPLSRRAAASPRWSAVDRAVAARGFRIALLLRLSPLVPQNFLGYGLSATRLALGSYALATFLGLLPSTSFYVYVGSLVRDASELLRGGTQAPGPWRWAALAGGLAISLAALVAVGRLTRNELRKAVPEPAAEREG